METKVGSNGSSLWNIRHGQEIEQEVRDDTISREDDNKGSKYDTTTDNNGDSSSAPYLDQGIMTQIFMRTPIESLYGEFRYACKSWLDIITDNSALHQYLNQQSLQQQPGLLIQYYNPYPETETDEFGLVKVKGNKYFTYLFKLGEQGIEERVDLTPLLNNRMHIRSCCNGLTLVNHWPNLSTFYVVNLLTKQRLILPPSADERWAKRALVLVFLPCTGRYKVVRSIDDARIEILTLPGGGYHDEDDLRWRLIEEPSEKLSTWQWHPPLAINGVLYWATYGLQYIMCFDATAERFYELPNPDFDPTEDFSDDRVYERGGFLELGGCLSLVTSRRHWCEEQNKVDVWILKNDGEWIKQSTINVDNNVMKYRFLNTHLPTFAPTEEPILILRNGEVLILKKQGSPLLLAYYVKTYQLSKLEHGSDLDLDEEQRWHLGLRFCGCHVNSTAPP